MEQENYFRGQLLRTDHASYHHDDPSGFFASGGIGDAQLGHSLINENHVEGDLLYPHDDRKEWENDSRIRGNDRTLQVFAKNAFIHNDERLEILLGELEGLDWDILLLSETRASDDCQFLYGGHRLLTCLGDTPFAGVGILLNQNLRYSIIAEKLLNGRILYVDSRLGR